MDVFNTIPTPIIKKPMITVKRRPPVDTFGTAENHRPSGQKIEAPTSSRIHCFQTSGSHHTRWGEAGRFQTATPTDNRPHTANKRGAAVGGGGGGGGQGWRCQERPGPAAQQRAPNRSGRGGTEKQPRLGAPVRCSMCSCGEGGGQAGMHTCTRVAPQRWQV